MSIEQLEEISIRRYSVRLKLSDETEFNFFHGAKIYRFISELINKHPLGNKIILDLPEIGRLKYRAGSFYNFGINLVNTEKEFEDHFLNSFRTADSQNGNSPFEYDSLEIKKIELPEFSPEHVHSGREISLSLVSPLRMLKKNRTKGSRYFDPHHFDCEQFLELLQLRAIKDLLGLEISAGELPSAPECRLKEKTLIWIDMPKPNKTTLGGVIGKIKFRASLSPFWQLLLWYGQFIHAGNNTSFGFGKYFVDNFNLIPDINPDKNFLNLILNDSNLSEAFYDVKENKGEPGVDGVTLEEFEANLFENLQIVKSDVEKRKYKPKELLGIIIPEKESKIRSLAIPTVRDRVIQRAVIRIIGGPIDRLLEESSFAYRKGFSRRGAAKKIVKAYREGYKYALESDIESFFDSVNWNILFSKLEILFFNDPLVPLLKKWVKAPIVFNGQIIKRTVGLPQGAVISPLLSNLYLDEFDEIILDNYKLVRFADDFVILCKSKEKAEEALEAVKKALKSIQLEINPGKTKIIDFDSGFQYLGYLFCRSLVIEKNKRPDRRRKLKFDDIEIPSDSWLSLVDFNRMKDTKKITPGQIKSFKPLYPDKEDYDKIPVYITQRNASVKIKRKYLEVGFENRGNYSNIKMPLINIQSVVVTGAPYFSLGALKSLSRQNIPVFFLDAGGRTSIKVDNSPPRYSLWMRQALFTENESFCLEFAKNIIEAKIHNDYIISKRLGFEKEITEKLKIFARRIKGAKSRDVIRGIEGKAANIHLSGMKSLIPVEWNFTERTRQPPLDAVNAMLSFGYTILHNQIAAAIKFTGLNPEISFYHTHSPYHYSLASDLQEEFRHIINALVVYVIRKGMAVPGDFIHNAESEFPVLMKKEFKKKFIELVEKRFLTEFIPQGGGEAVSYRNFFYLQARSVLISLREGKLLYSPLRIK